MAAEKSEHFETRVSLQREKMTAAMDAAGAAASLQVALEEISRLKAETAVYEGLLSLAMQSGETGRENLRTKENLEMRGNVVF